MNRAIEIKVREERRGATFFVRLDGSSASGRGTLGPRKMVRLVAAVQCALSPPSFHQPSDKWHSLQCRMSSINFFVRLRGRIRLVSTMAVVLSPTFQQSLTCCDLATSISLAQTESSSKCRSSQAPSCPGCRFTCLC